MALRRKFLSIALLSVLSVSLLSSWVTILMLDRHEALLYRTSAQSLRYIAGSIETELASAVTISDYVLASPSLQEYLMTMLDSPDHVRVNEAKKGAYDILNHYLFSTPYLQSITLVSDGGNVNIGTSLGLDYEAIEMLRAQAATSNGTAVWRAGSAVNGKVLCVRQIRQKAYLSLRSLATLIICVDIDEIVDSALKDPSMTGSGGAASGRPGGGVVPASGTSAGSSMYASGAEGYGFTLFAEGSSLTPERLPDVTQAELRELQPKSDTPYSVVNLNGRKHFLVRGSLDSVDWQYLYLIDYDSVFSGIQQMRLQYVGILLVFTVITLLLTNRQTGRMLAHFQLLVRKMNRFKAGDMTAANHEESARLPQDELGNLNRQFDDMVDGIRQLIDDNYVKQLTIKDAQIHMLEAQINPHFMYNTLDSINWLAQKYGADDISGMVLSLGSLLRANLSVSGDFVTLETEIQLLGYYIHIQKFRFKDRLHWEMRVDPAYNPLSIPKMILQPLVENAIKHGVEPSYDGGTVSLDLTELEDTLEIRVSNTSSTFEEELLDKLEKHELRPSGTGIGLTNIDRRLRLIYGEAHGLRFRNENGLAVAIVTIPKTKGDD